AQERIPPWYTEEPNRQLPIEPPAWSMDGLVIPFQRVDVSIDGQVATTHIEQLFRNEGQGLLEGSYFFPLPVGAAVSQLTMWVDGKPIEAKILEKDEARAVYDEIVRQLRDPALLEYAGRDAVQANVFPIPAGEERLVEISYTHLLPAENGLIQYVYPQSTDLYSNAPLGEQSIRVEVASDEPIRTIYSPSHPVAISREGEFSAVAGYEAQNVTPGEDFALYYTVSPEVIGLNLLSYKEPGEDGFFLMLVTPGIEAGETAVDKDVILVLDTSGSMEGEKMAQAKEAATYVVEHLNEGDRFNIVAFSTGTDLFEDALVAAAEPGAAGQFIDSLEAVGGTNISEALLEAAALVDSERPSTIIFLTDGLATEGITDTSLLLQNVAAQMPANARLFAFGVGDDVDTLLLDSLAQAQRGATTYVRPGQAIDEAVSGFYAKVGSPVLTDISLDTGDIRTSRLYPAQLPDLFAGSQLVVAGRYRDAGEATITLRGTVNGREMAYHYEDQQFVAEGGQPFIPRLWATRAIGQMMQQIRLQGEDPELVQSIVNLSTRYGIITPYTSFLIEEDDIIAQTGDFDAVMEAEEALAAPASVSGEQAVDRAALEGELAAAEAPAPLPTMVAKDGGSTGGPAVRYAGSKTFFQRGGVWVDSLYDPALGEPVVVPFASQPYFDLLAEWPEAGAYLALGEEVQVVLGDQAYLVTAGAETVSSGQPAVDSQQATGNGETGNTGIGQATVDGGQRAAGSEGQAVDNQNVTPAAQAEQAGVPLTVCGAAVVLPLLFVGAWGAAGRRRR
ncbi:MAG: VIT domain-containing protein, partial [Candidatus Promineifilaceae bacterium]